MQPAMYHQPLPVSLRKFQLDHALPILPTRSLDGGLAVIVPCYNHIAYLEETLTSLAAQTYRPFEAIFVDDHSTDKTKVELERLCPMLPAGIRATVLQTPSNQGQAAAINLAVENTRASIFVILNDDDYLMHDALEAETTIFQARPEIYLLGADVVPFSGSGFLDQLSEADKRIASRYPKYIDIPLVFRGPGDIDGMKHAGDLSMSHSGMLFHRAAWQAVGGYYSNKRARVVVHADRDFQMRVISLFPGAVTYDASFAFWRSDSSVDRGRYS